jgi:hypothetical protein
MNVFILTYVLFAAVTAIEARSQSKAMRISVRQQVSRYCVPNESVVPPTEILADVAVEQEIAKPEKRKKQYFYKKPTLQVPPGASTTDTTTSFPCSSERYRQGLEGNRE